MRSAALLALLLACSRPAPVTPPAPVENRGEPPASATDACPRDLSWLANARYLRYTQFAHGHFGEWRFHADFYRLDGADVFGGVATGTFRHHERAPLQVATKAVSVPTSEATALLTALRDGIQTPPQPDERTLLVSDSSRSIVIQIEAMAFDPRVGMHPNFYVQFFADDGETEPQQWNIRGCAFQPPTAARRELQKLTEAFARGLGNDAMYTQLESRAPPP